MWVNHIHFLCSTCSQGEVISVFRCGFYLWDFSCNVKWNWHCETTTTLNKLVVAFCLKFRCRFSSSSNQIVNKPHDTVCLLCVMRSDNTKTLSKSISLAAEPPSWVKLQDLSPEYAQTIPAAGCVPYAFCVAVLSGPRRLLLCIVMQVVLILRRDYDKQCLAASANNT